MTHLDGPNGNIFFGPNLEHVTLPAEIGQQVDAQNRSLETGVSPHVEAVVPSLSAVAMAETTSSAAVESNGVSRPAPARPGPGMFANKKTAASSGIVRKVETTGVDLWGAEKVQHFLNGLITTRSNGTWMTDEQLIEDTVRMLRRRHGMPLEYATDALRERVGRVAKATDGIDGHDYHPGVYKLLSPTLDKYNWDKETWRLDEEMQIMEANMDALIGLVTANGPQTMREDQLLALREKVTPHLTFKKNSARYDKVLSVILQSDPRTGVAMNGLQKVFTLSPAPAQ